MVSVERIIRYPSFCNKFYALKKSKVKVVYLPLFINWLLIATKNIITLQKSRNNYSNSVKKNWEQETLNFF